MSQLNSYRKKRLKKRAVAGIMGTLIMMAVVTGVGALLLFQGITAINEFNANLVNFLGIKGDAARESLTIEHVYFNPDNKDLHIWVRNSGIVDVTIDSIAMVDLESQDLRLNVEDDGTAIGIRNVEELQFLTNTANEPTLNAGDTQWNDSDYYPNKEFAISITTMQGNSYEIVASPFNT